MNQDVEFVVINVKEKTKYIIVLLYYENNMDLIFTGHAHGGQVRIPGIGGLFAPDQGIFPKYTSGIYNISS